MNKKLKHVEYFIVPFKERFDENFFHLIKNKLGYGNGYVLLKKDHPISIDYDLLSFGQDELFLTKKYNLDVSGGITLCDRIEDLYYSYGNNKTTFFKTLEKEIQNYKDYYLIIGFDTAHGWETHDNFPKKRVEEEAYNLARKCEELAFED